jgi:hypothetical protein
MSLQYKHKTIVGIFDSDGSITIRVLGRANKLIGFSVLASFTQATANNDVLKPIAKELDATTMNKFSSEERNTTRLDINFNTGPGEKLLKIFKKYPPKSPGKRRDYLIALQVLEFARTRTFASASEQLDIWSLTPESKERVCSAAAVFLIYNMVNESQRSTGGRRLSAEAWYLHLLLSEEELEQGLILGRSLLEKIEAEETFLRQLLTGAVQVNGRVRQLKLSIAYLVGFYIGDGSLQIWMTLPTPYKTLSVTPCFTLVECTYGADLLKGVKGTLGEGSISTSNVKASRYKLDGWARCSDIVIPMLKKYRLPATRQEQFNTFVTVCTMGTNRRHLTRSGLFEMVNLCWYMNKDSGRILSKQEFLKNAKTYFDYQESRRKMRSLLHQKLRKKFLNTKGNLKKNRTPVVPLPINFDSYIT